MSINIKTSQDVVADERFEEVRSKIIKMVSNSDIPSMSIAVAKEGEIIWEESFGWANVEKKIKATPESIYPIASLSKSITATGLMVLAQKAQINLDAPVTDSLSSVKLTTYEGKADDITIRKILNMTAGIPHGFKCYYEPCQPPPLQEIIKQYGFLAYAPGEVVAYGNFPYGVIELIIEDVSGRSFEDFMQSEVFHPLGMTRTFVRYNPDWENEIVVKYAADKTIYPHIYFVPVGAAGIYSTTHDLIKYGLFHLKQRLPDQKPILNNKILDSMHMSKAQNLSETLFTLGWGHVELNKGLIWLISNGGISGAFSMLTLIPSDDLAVVCLTNITSQPSIADQMAIEIIDALVPNFKKKATETMQQYEMKHAPKPYKPIPQLIGQWEGVIKTSITEIATNMIFRENGKTLVKLGNQDETVLGGVSLIKDEQLTGNFQGFLPNEERYQGEHPISIHMKLNQKKMYGVATATFETKKGVFQLPYYINLNKRK